MDYQEQVFFNVPLNRLEPIFKGWIREVQNEAPKTNQLQKQSEVEEFGGIELPMKMLGLAKATIYSKVSNGELPVMKQGKKLIFSSLELMQFIKDGRKKTNSEIEAEAVDYLNKKQRR
jgi:hypothetical protein